MTRSFLVLQILLSLLSSSWVQAASVQMIVPMQSEQPAMAAALADESMPPCHRAAMLEALNADSATDMAVSVTSKMDCCADGSDCQCDSLFQQMSFPSVGLEGLSYQAPAIQKAFSQDNWVAVSPVSLFRPPIQKA